MFRKLFKFIVRALRGRSDGNAAPARRGPPIPTGRSAVQTEGLARSLEFGRPAYDRTLPYGLRPTRRRQLTLLAELIGDDWRGELRERLGIEPQAINRRQAAAEIMRITGGRRPDNVARSTWHRVAVDPEWVDRRRTPRRRDVANGGPWTPAIPSGTSGEPALPVQLKALRLLAERLGLDVPTEAKARFDRDPAGLDKREAAALLTDLTQRVLGAGAQA